MDTLREIDEAFDFVWSDTRGRPPLREELSMFSLELDAWRILHLRVAGTLSADGVFSARIVQLEGVTAEADNLEGLGHALAELAESLHSVRIPPEIVARAIEADGRRQGWLAPAQRC